MPTMGSLMALPFALLITACAADRPQRSGWSSTAFYPPEACWQVQTMDRSAPGYWSIRAWCDARDRVDGNR